MLVSQFSAVQLLSRVRPFATPWTAARHASLSIPNSQNLLKLMSIEWVIHLIHPTISSFVIPFSPLLQSFQASGSFPMSQFFASGGQSIGVAASGSVLPMNAAAAAKSLQSCPTLCDPIDGSPLCSAIPGILQARTLEWVAISFSNA